MQKSLIVAALLGCAACTVTTPEEEAKSQPASNETAAKKSPVAEADLLGTAFGFADVADAAQPPQPVMQAQVVLDRLGFSPRVIDGKQGSGFALALRGFQMSRDLPDTGTLDDATKQALAEWRDIPATRSVRIPEGFAKAVFVPKLPEDPAAQAKLPGIGYRDILEMLAERFHTTPETIVALNPREDRGKRDGVIRVPNVGEPDLTDAPEDAAWRESLMTLGVSANQPKADQVIVDKSEGVLRAYDAQDKLIAQFPATMGSEHDPLPLGTWTIKGVARNPEFHYNPKLFWDVSDNKEAVLLPPGPNGPVGAVWIDLSKPHYGIHGTPEPATIGKSESHGCIRLTNWDAVRLAQMVTPGMKALFQE